MYQFLFNVAATSSTAADIMKICNCTKEIYGVCDDECQRECGGLFGRNFRDYQCSLVEGDYSYNCTCTYGCSC